MARSLAIEMNEHAGGRGVWRLGHGRSLSLDRPRLMAILNVTPDSFFAGSRARSVEAAVAMAREAFESGADMLDIGGESTRPGAERIGPDEQAARVVPVIEAIRAERGDLASIPISVDTTLPAVAARAIDAGADAINDVSGASPGGPEGGDAIAQLAARVGAGLVLMHRLAPPDRDRYSDEYVTPPEYGDVVDAVCDALRVAAARAERAGVAGDSILLDPGLGFGKTVEQNLALVRGTPDLCATGYPVLSALSRKSFVGRVSEPGSERTAPEDRLPGSLALSVVHLAAGARVFRVHDVGPQRAALAAAWSALESPSGGPPVP